MINLHFSYNSGERLHNPRKLRRRDGANNRNETIARAGARRGNPLLIFVSPGHNASRQIHSRPPAL